MFSLELQNLILILGLIQKINFNDKDFRYEFHESILCWILFNITIKETR